MESHLLEVKEPEPRSAEAASYANEVVNPNFRKISTLDRRCNRLDLMGTLDPVVVPLPISAAGFLTLFLPKLAAEGVQIHCDDVEMVIHDEFMGMGVVSNQEAIDNLRRIGVNVDVVGQIQTVKVVSIRPIEEDLGIVEDMAEVSIGRPRTPPPIPDLEFVEKQIIEEKEVQPNVEYVERNEPPPASSITPQPTDFPLMFHELEEEVIPEIVDTAGNLITEERVQDAVNEAIESLEKEKASEIPRISDEELKWLQEDLTPIVASRPMETIEGLVDNTEWISEQLKEIRDQRILNKVVTDRTRRQR